MMTLMPVLGFASGVTEIAILGSLDSSILARSGIQDVFNWTRSILKYAQELKYSLVVEIQSQP